MLSYAHKRVIALLVCLVIGIAWQSRVSWEHSHQYESHDARPNEADKKTTQVTADERIANYTRWVAILTGILSASTLLLWWVTRKSANVAENALTVLERPYLVFHEIKTDIGLFLSPNTVILSTHYPSFHFTVINYGRTPANIERAMIQFDVLDRIPEEPKIEDISLKNPGYKMAVVIIGQNREHTFHRLRLVRIKFPPQERLDVKNGTLSLYCYGMIEYRDIFDKSHLTNFCRCFDFAQAEWVPVGERHRNQGN